MKVTVREGQSLVDLALQYHGTLDGLFEIAQANAMSITDMIGASDELEVEQASNDVVSYINNKKKLVIAASGDTTHGVGIGYYIIGQNFIII